MNVRVLAALCCVIGAVVALAAPSSAVRVAAWIIGALVAAMVLDGFVKALHDVGPQRPAPITTLAPTGPDRPADLWDVEVQVKIDSASGVMSDAVFARLQAAARSAVRVRYGLDARHPADHGALADSLTPTLFTLVMNGLAVDPSSDAGHQELRPVFVPANLRPPLSAMPALLDELETL